MIQMKIAPRNLQVNNKPSHLSHIHTRAKLKPSSLNLEGCRLNILFSAQNHGIPKFPIHPKTELGTVLHNLLEWAEKLVLDKEISESEIKLLVEKQFSKKIPTHLFHYDLSAFDESEIPDLSHEGGVSLKLWLAQTLGKDPAFLDPWGNEYVYEFPLEDGGPGYRLFSMGPDGKTGDQFSQDDIK